MDECEVTKHDQTDERSVSNLYLVLLYRELTIILQKYISETRDVPLQHALLDGKGIITITINRVQNLFQSRV